MKTLMNIAIQNQSHHKLQSESKTLIATFIESSSTRKVTAKFELKTANSEGGSNFNSQATPLRSFWDAFRMLLLLYAMRTFKEANRK